MKFSNRHEAGRQLAENLAAYANRSDTLVLGLPRGGVPVAEPVASTLRAPLDVFVVRKLGVPGHPELAMGAIASGGIRILNKEVIEALQIPFPLIETVAIREETELARREQAYRGQRPVPEVSGKIVILVDDGIATGSTMTAAITALRQRKARFIVAAAPTIARETRDLLRRSADAVVCVIAPQDFCGVGQWYEDFAQTTDGEVREILAHHASVGAP